MYAKRCCCLPAGAEFMLKSSLTISVVAPAPNDAKLHTLSCTYTQTDSGCSCLHIAYPLDVNTKLDWWQAHDSVGVSYYALATRLATAQCHE